MALIIYWIPLPALSPQAHTLAAIIGWLTWRVTEPIPMSGLVGAVLCVLFGVADARKSLGPFADPTIFLFIGSFILPEAMAAHALDKRFAYGIMSRKWVENSSARILLVHGTIAAFLSMWIRDTATTAMMFPVGLGIISGMADIVSEKTGKPVDASRPRFGTGMMCMPAYASSMGGNGTPVGTPPNLIGIAIIEKFVKMKIPFFQWMVLAIPLMVLMFMVLFALMSLLHKPEIKPIEGSHEYVKREKEKLGKWTSGQINSMIAFIESVTKWPSM